jgi:peptide-methionine (R)-S-oxide reductase
MNDLSRRIFIFGGATSAAAAVFFGLNRLSRSAVAGSSETNLSAGPVTIIEFGEDGQRLRSATHPKLMKSPEEWQKQLSNESFIVTRRAGTEEPYSGALNFQHGAGIYRCICCGNALFDSATKFESGTGWPSFSEPIAKENIYERLDLTMGSVRREVKCTLCDAHLGHVFDDGPDPTGLRYCMNSVALHFSVKR